MVATFRWRRKRKRRREKSNLNVARGSALPSHMNIQPPVSISIPLSGDRGVDEVRGQHSEEVLPKTCLWGDPLPLKAEIEGVVCEYITSVACRPPVLPLSISLGLNRPDSSSQMACGRRGSRNLAALLLLLAQIIPSTVAFGACVPGMHANHLGLMACSQHPGRIGRGGGRGSRRSVGTQDGASRGRTGNSEARGEDKYIVLDEGARWVQLEKYKALNQIIVGHGDAEGVLEAISSPIVDQKVTDGGNDGRGTMAGMRPVNAVNVATALGKLARAPPSRKILADGRFVCVLEVLEEMLVDDPPNDMQERQLAQIAWSVVYHPSISPPCSMSFIYLFPFPLFPFLFTLFRFALSSPSPSLLLPFSSPSSPLLK